MVNLFYRSIEFLNNPLKFIQIILPENTLHVLVNPSFETDSKYSENKEYSRPIISFEWAKIIFDGFFSLKSHIKMHLSLPPDA